MIKFKKYLEANIKTMFLINPRKFLLKFIFDHSIVLNFELFDLAL